MESVSTIGVCTLKLKPEEKNMLCDLEEEYTCGSVLFPPSSKYHSTIIARASLTCQDPVEPQYYSTRTANFLCSLCGGPKETLVEDEVVRNLKQRKQVVSRGAFAPLDIFCPPP